MFRLSAFAFFVAAVSGRTFFDALNNNETTYNQVIESIYATLDRNGQGFFTNSELQNGTAVGLERLKVPFLKMVNPANVTVDAADSNGT